MDSIDPFPNQDMFTETLEKLEDQLKPLAKSNIIIPEAVLSGTRMSEEEIEQLKSKYEVMQHFKGICNSSLLPRCIHPKENASFRSLLPLTVKCK